MPEILFYGDPHGDWLPLLDECAYGARPDAVVLLGDMDLGTPLERAIAPVLAVGIPVWWIPGNHDVDSVEWHDRLFGSALADRNIHGRVIDVDGVRLAGLGGTFMASIWDPRQVADPRYRTRAEYLECNRLLVARDQLSEALKRRASAHAAELKRLAGELAAAVREIEATFGRRMLGDRGQPPFRGDLTLQHRATIFPKDVDGLAGLEADILVTHEAPSCCVRPDLGGGLPFALGFEAIDLVAESLGVRTIVHGHHHYDYDAVLDNGIRVRGVGKATVWRLQIELRPARPRLPDSHERIPR